MEDPIAQKPPETSTDADRELQTDSAALDVQTEEREMREETPVDQEPATPAEVETTDEGQTDDLASEDAQDEDQQQVEIEFSVEGIGETEAQADAQTEARQEREEFGESDEAEPQGEEETPTVESVIEAILFASDEPLTDSRLANIVETTGKQVRQCIEALNTKYEANHNAFRIEQIAGGNQMLTMSVYNNWLRKMLRARSDSKLSPAAMETLAIIAYKQPVIRADIEAIRGVAVGEVIRSLMYKGLVKIVGRAEILGRPMLYGTTKKFLEVFGLNSLKDLPKAEELKKPD